MEHILNIEQQKPELEQIFKKIQESNTILFLGAGASVGEKKYLSKELIQYYESYLGRVIGENNITNFVDILSADDDFSRNHFDIFVADILRKLKTTEAHKILASIPWREIITTNYDLLVENAYDELSQTFQKIYELKVIRNVKQYNYRESNTEIKYIKLNGDIYDTSLYPLAFSTDDFSRLKSFYRLVLNDLKNISSEISFLTIGYSFTDDFGRSFLEKFDSYNFRDKKWIINVDPYPNENALAYYKKNKICIIKCSFQDFFLGYKEWEDRNAKILVHKKGLSITNSTDAYVSYPPKLLLNLEGVIKQLNLHTKDKFIKDVDFYKGEEPTFNLIMRDVDVLKLKYLQTFQSSINKILVERQPTFLPIFFVTGDFGIGKSTFTLRLIYELEKNASMDLIAFEIVDFNRLKREYLIEVINTSKSKNIVFYCDELEVESSFKSLMSIQRDLSIEQFQDCNVFFIVPIRENILEKYKLARTIPNFYELKLEGNFETNEIDDLLEKLKKAELIYFRDATEKKTLLNKIKNDYNSDSFIALMAIITSGKHENDLISSYNQLSSETQKAFLYTALIHKHKLLMPASWLKQNTSMTWEEFSNKVIKAEGKGILFQEVKVNNGTQPDLYFRTKHPLIAEKLINRIIPSQDRQFALYEKMLRNVEIGLTNSYLVNNLLKSFIRSEEYSETQINKLFDTANSKLSEDPYFLLNYAINLQNRRTKVTIEKAISTIIYAESLLEFRNHRFIHRRAVLNFELAKIYFEEENQLNFTIYYINEAKELFVTKQLLDPFSSFSYVDYIKVLVWELDYIEFDEEEELETRILVEEQFDLANKTVTDGIERIDVLYSTYAEYLNNVTDNKDYLEYLEELYLNTRLRPYACILLFNYYDKINNIAKCNEIISEAEYYQESFEVVKFLFKFYGRKLHIPDLRVKFLRLSRNNPNLEKANPLRFNYFNFVAETYNARFYDGKKYLTNIQSKYHSINPEFNNIWLDSDGEQKRFEAIVVKRSGEKYKAVKISSMGLTARLEKGNYDEFELGAKVTVILHFYLYGLMGKIVLQSDFRTNIETDTFRE